MTNLAEQAALERAQRLATARAYASAWGYWCVYGMWGGKTGRKPRLDSAAWQREYRPPPQWHPPEPRMPEADEPTGVAVQKAYAVLPQVYRRALAAEFVARPFIVPLKEGELEVIVARRARVSVGSYAITIERALLALANVMKRRGLWRSQ